MYAMLLDEHLGKGSVDIVPAELVNHITRLAMIPYQSGGVFVSPQRARLIEAQPDVAPKARIPARARRHAA
jgi:hypothetical protein